jgi:hypothetical protein
MLRVEARRREGRDLLPDDLDRLRAWKAQMPAGAPSSTTTRAKGFGTCLVDQATTISSAVRPEPDGASGGSRGRFGDVSRVSRRLQT